MGEAKTCGDCSKWEEKMYWTHFQIKHFCLFLVGDFIDEFALPKTFANHLRGKLPDTVILKGPSGFTWNVGLVTVDDNLFFRNGWKEFIINHSLEENYILVFKYSGDSHFDVLMFDPVSFCEKETSYFVLKCGHTKLDRPTTDKTRNSSVELNNDSLDDGVEGPSTKKLRKDDDLMAMPLPLPSGQRNLPRSSRKIQKKTHSIKPVSSRLKLISEEHSTCAEEEITDKTRNNSVEINSLDGGVECPSTKKPRKDDDLMPMPVPLERCILPRACRKIQKKTRSIKPVSPTLKLINEEPSTCGEEEITDKTRNNSVEINSLDDGVECPSTKKPRKDDDLMPMPLPLERCNLPRACRKIQKKNRSIKPVSPTLKLINEEPSTCAEEEITDKTRNNSVEINSLDDGVECPSTKKPRKDDDLMPMPLPLERCNLPRASRKIQKKTCSIKPVSPTLKLINEEPSTCAEEEKVTPSAPHIVLDENEDCVCLSEVDFGVERIDERMSISKVNSLPRKTTAKKWITLPTIQRRQVVYRPVKNKDWLYHHMFYDISCEEAATIEAWMGNDFSGPFGNEFLFKSDDIWLNNSHALHFVYEREDGHCTNLRWISTDAINSYLQLLRKRQATHGSQMRKSFFFPTYYSVIAERDGLDTDRTDPTFNGISKDLDLIFLPVIGKDHFMLVVADLGDKTVTIYDSMPNPAHKKDVVIVVHWMIEFVCRQILGLNDVKWTPCQAMKIPVQDDNGDDCGIYVLTFIVCLATVGEIREFKKNDIKNMRRRMLLELMAQKLLPA